MRRAKEPDFIQERIEDQIRSRTITQAINKMERTHNACAFKNMRIDCDTCPIERAHELVLEYLESKSNEGFWEYARKKAAYAC